MDTAKASKLLRELKGSKFLPYYNVYPAAEFVVILPDSLSPSLSVIKEDLVKELKKDIKGYCDNLLTIIK